MAWAHPRTASIPPSSSTTMLPAKPGWRMRLTGGAGIFGLGLMTGWFLAFHLFTALLIPLMIGMLAGILLMARTGKKRRRR